VFWRNALTGSSSSLKKSLVRGTVIPLALALSLASAATVSPRAQAAESSPSSSTSGGATAAPAGSPTAVEANAFLARAEQELTDLSVLQSRAGWVNSTYITDDTDVLAAYFTARQTELTVRFALEAARFHGASGLSEDAQRKIDLLRSSVDLPASTATGAALALSTLVTRLTSAYGKGHGTLRGQPIAGTDIEEEMGTNRNPAELKEMWTSWHDRVGVPMRGEYARLVGLPMRAHESSAMPMWGRSGAPGMTCRQKHSWHSPTGLAPKNWRASHEAGGSPCPRHGLRMSSGMRLYGSP
jgi:hypothetical protein